MLRQPKEKHGRTALFPNINEGTQLEIDFNEERPDAGTIYVTIFVRYDVIGSKERHYTAVTYVTKPDDAATRFYGMVGGDLRLKYGDIHQRIDLTLSKGLGGLPIVT